MKAYVYRLFNKLKFKQKLVLSYLVVILIPILTLGIYSFTQSKSLLNEQAEQSLDRNAGAAAESVNYKLERYETIVNSILFNAVIQRIVSDQYIDIVNYSRDLNDFLSPYFNMISILNKEVQQISIYTENRMPEYGEYIIAADKVAGEPWYKQALAMESGTSWHVEGNQVFGVGRFPAMFTGTKNNLLYIRMNGGDLFGAVRDSLKGYGVIVSDAQGQVIFTNRNEKGDGILNVNPKLIMESGQGIATLNGHDFIVNLQNIPQTGWSLYTYVPSADITHKADSILNATLIVIGICILILIVMISIFANTMLRRIHRLNQWMKQVEHGDLTLVVPNASMDEIGQLTRRFGHMLKRINDLIQEVYANNIIQKEAELRALQSQINPHFLYNTLSFINWKALRSDAHDISHMVTTLSTFYRTALNRGASIISVRDELENIRSYIEIMLIMNDYSFDVKYEIEEEVNHYSMVNLILQPLVENAIKHGIHQKESGRGLLRIRAAVNGPDLVFRVEDNGPGIAGQAAEELLKSPSSGYGLKNVNERIQLTFGFEYGISIESEEGRGTDMVVKIPKTFGKEEVS